MKKDTKTRVIEDVLKDVILASMTYPEFRELVSNLARENGTTGPEQSEAYKRYTELNDRRMRRWDKTLKIGKGDFNKIKHFSGNVFWLVITESWCGDAAPTLPVMNRISEINERIRLRIILRSDYPEVMDQFLTEGKRSIPKLIIVDAMTFSVLGTWGPLPTEALSKAAAYKRMNGTLTPEFKEELQQWFNADKGKNTVNDLVGLLALE